ncbi:MAG: 16S rRNA (cytosine(1402)-N(4))-methyltransferase RsmH [Ruminococcaceae bacterium]|nr:16S rRNA (cytosine(1402)-N(4))-methyltransferase RsmH [Oscillospiraceae bacterium]
MDQPLSFHHIPVMLAPCIEALQLAEGGTYVDATLGGAGHSTEIAKRLTTGRLIGFDRDPAAIRVSGERLAAFGDRIRLINRNFSEIKRTLEELSIEGINGALMDLGVSSHQLDEAERGFSYMQDAPLDMRMNPNDALSAYDVVNTYGEEKLSDIIFAYGEERWAKRIAAFIAEARTQKPIRTTGELVDIIKKAVPKSARKDGPHPAKRTFQAIRIEVNNELGGLKQAVRDFADCLLPGGRLAVITFHSLEDRIVKTAFREMEKGCICPVDYPVCVCGIKSLGRVVTKKPILPDARELAENPRARSAKLRVFEKTGDSTIK